MLYFIAHFQHCYFLLQHPSYLKTILQRPHFRWARWLAGNQLHINLLQTLLPSKAISGCYYSEWRRWEVVLNNTGLIGPVLQLISIKSLGRLSPRCERLRLCGVYCTSPSCRLHRRGHRSSGRGWHHICLPEQWNCGSVNCCKKKSEKKRKRCPVFWFLAWGKCVLVPKIKWSTQRFFE